MAWYGKNAQNNRYRFVTTRIKNESLFIVMIGRYYDADHERLHTLLHENVYLEKKMQRIVFFSDKYNEKIISCTKLCLKTNDRYNGDMRRLCWSQLPYIRALKVVSAGGEGPIWCIFFFLQTYP